MKKILVTLLTIGLILSLCACGRTAAGDPIISPGDDSAQSELFEQEEDITDGNPETELPKKMGEESTGSFEAFSDARKAFYNNVMEKSSEQEIVMYNQSLVLTPESEVFDYMTPLLYWGETLDEEELATKEITLGLLAGEGKSFQSADLKKESDNSYTMEIETKKGEQIRIQVEYHPDIDAMRLVAENNGEQALLFEYAKTGTGYAAQFYFNAVVGGGYGSQNKAMCVYKTIFSGEEGSCARFDDADEPDSLMDGVPDEETFISGATHWFMLKDGKFTGELNGTAF